MMKLAHRSVAGLVAGLVCSAIPAAAVSPLKLSGAISGVVTDGAGVPQMGAAVFLYNRYERLYQRALTDPEGAFSFSGLSPDLYTVKVTLASFVPAVKAGIQVQAGVRSLLNISMASLFSSVTLVFPGSGSRALMSEDWKWVLRTSAATRPVLRFLPHLDSNRDSQRSAIFTDTRGVLTVSAGDGGRVSAFGNEADLGTAFAVATSLFGNNQLEVSGNVGYGASGNPSTAFRTSISRDIGTGSPELSVTMRQLFVPGRFGMALAGGAPDSSLPVLRTMSLNFEDRTQLSESVSFQYGFSLDSVAFLDRLNYFSPFARLTWSGEVGDIDFTYTSGNPRPELAGSGPGSTSELLDDIDTLSLFPRVSLRDRRARVQRGENFEVGFSKKAGSRTFRVGAYRESVTNTALMMVAPAGLYSSGDILPDLFSRYYTFNAGDYHTSGYTASVTQRFGEHVSITGIYGALGALTPPEGELVSEDPDHLRAMIRASRRQTATLRASATSPWTGTQLVASYQFADARMATRGHMYSTRGLRPDPGFNVFIRQPIPSFAMLPWRMEATADLRNLRAQGYLPVSFADGRRLLLLQTPRSLRGGLSFIF
jgi:hypothetical protein